MASVNNQRTLKMTQNLQSILLDEKQAAEVIGCSPQTLRIWRVEKKHLRYIKLGRMIRYHQADIEAFVADSVREVAA
jgi:excisionase family DNA binding protein